MVLHPRMMSNTGLVILFLSNSTMFMSLRPLVRKLPFDSTALGLRRLLVCWSGKGIIDAVILDWVVMIVIITVGVRVSPFGLMRTCCSMVHEVVVLCRLGRG